MRARPCRRPVEPASRGAAGLGWSSVRPCARPLGDLDRFVPGQCRQGHADRELHRRARAPERAYRHHLLLERPGDDLLPAAGLLYRRGDDRGLAVQQAEGLARTQRGPVMNAGMMPLMQRSGATSCRDCCPPWSPISRSPSLPSRSACSRPAARAWAGWRWRGARRLGHDHLADAGGADLRRDVLPAERSCATSGCSASSSRCPAS